jgi:hypothetical protein
MAKPGFPVPGPSGLAEWLPLLGSICQVLAALGEEDESEPREPESVARQNLKAGEKSG